MTYIIIYITTLHPLHHLHLPIYLTSHHLQHHPHHLQHRQHHLHQLQVINFWGTPTNLEKCHLHRSWLAGTWTSTTLARLFCTESVTQKLLHRSSGNFRVIKLCLNPCKIKLLQFFYFSPAADSQPVAHETSPSTPCRTSQRLQMPVLLVLGQPSAEWCGEMRNFFAAATVCGDRDASDANMW